MGDRPASELPGQSRTRKAFKEAPAQDRGKQTGGRTLSEKRRKRIAFTAQVGRGLPNEVTPPFSAKLSGKTVRPAQLVSSSSQRMIRETWSPLSTSSTEFQDSSSELGQHQRSVSAASATRKLVPEINHRTPNDLQPMASLLPPIFLQHRFTGAFLSSEDNEGSCFS